MLEPRSDSPIRTSRPHAWAKLPARIPAWRSRSRWLPRP